MLIPDFIKGIDEGGYSTLLSTVELYYSEWVYLNPLAILVVSFMGAFGWHAFRYIG